jgi:hypothetical protein
MTALLTACASVTFGCCLSSPSVVVIVLFQIVVHKVDRGVLLFPLFLPLLQSLNVAYNSLHTQSLAEGTTYCNRLQNLVEQKVRTLSTHHMRRVYHLCAVLTVAPCCGAAECQTKV